MSTQTASLTVRRANAIHWSPIHESASCSPEKAATSASQDWDGFVSARVLLDTGHCPVDSTLHPVISAEQACQISFGQLRRLKLPTAQEWIAPICEEWLETCNVCHFEPTQLICISDIYLSTDKYKTNFELGLAQLTTVHTGDLFRLLSLILLFFLFFFLSYWPSIQTHWFLNAVWLGPSVSQWVFSSASLFSLPSYGHNVQNSNVKIVWPLTLSLHVLDLGIEQLTQQNTATIQQ